MMGYGLLLKYGLPALLILSLGTYIVTLRADNKALEVRNAVLTETNTRNAETIMTLDSRLKIANETCDSRLKNKDAMIASIRKIFMARNPVSGLKSGEKEGANEKANEKADIDNSGLRDVLNSMWAEDNKAD